ncbi:MAG: class I SAM-dependent methyltransferase [Acidobacteriota bacterium]
MPFANAYADAGFAEAYSQLQFPGTYYLAFRDLPALVSRHATGRRALDFGCGAGRSTRFLRSLGFDAIGIDIAEDMLARAHALDPEGDYRLIPDGHLGAFEVSGFDLVFSAFTFDNIPTRERKVVLERCVRLVVPGRAPHLVERLEIPLDDVGRPATAFGTLSEERHAPGPAG